MIHEYYCLDDKNFTEFLSSDVRDNLEKLVELLERLLDEDILIHVPSSIEHIQIGLHLNFYDLYTLNFQDSDKFNNIDRDLIQRFIVIRTRLETVDAEPLDATLFDSVNSIDHTSGSAEIIAKNTNDSEGIALILIESNNLSAGEYVLRVDEFIHNIYAITSETDLPIYTRWLIKKFNLSENDFFILWDRAFPLLLKSDNLSFRRFHGDYETLLRDVVSHLEFLNDHFIRLWRECDMDFYRFMRAAKSKYDVDFSNESPKTRKSAQKMNQRIAKFSDKQVQCEIHTKISRNINRIHLHPPIEDIGGPKVLVGIFVDHLDT